MSGRDLKTFLTVHRRQTLNFTKTEERLLPRYLAGTHRGRQEYRAVDYGHLLAEVKGRREEGERGRRRVEGLWRKVKDSREGALLRQHQELWEREGTRLKDAWKGAVSELEAWRSHILLHGPDKVKSFLAESTEYESTLWEERERFESETVEPIWCLRVDLQHWTEGVREGGQCLRPEEQREVLEQLEMVKGQQVRIQEILQSEFDLLSADLKQANERYLSVSEPEVARGVPAEVMTLDWPDHALRDSMLMEFCLLDDRYQAMLGQLVDECRDDINTPSGGWSTDDDQRFSAILSQYPTSMSDRRTLYLDRLRRELPHKTRREIVAHEAWHSRVRHYRTQRKAYLRSWAGQRAELVKKVEGVCRESVKLRDAMEGEREERERQRLLCCELAKKVSQWRREKVENVRIEAELAAKVRDKEEEERRREEEREKAFREKQKAKVRQYHAVIEQRRTREREEEAQRLTEAAAKQKELAEIDRERVQYRAVLRAQRQDEVRKEEMREESERRARDQRLEHLRQQVRVDVPADPVRILRETQASLARALAHQETELELQQPLFSLHGYSDQTVTSDARFRVAMALRNIGLHTTDYARKVLASIPPPLPPRPDQKSSIFK